MRRVAWIGATCIGFLACGLDDTVVGAQGSGDDASVSHADGGADGSFDDATTSDRDADSDAALPNGGFEKTITIHASQVSSTLADFPVWLNLTDADLAAHAASDGHDIFFVTADGTPLAYEIQSWVGATGSLAVWVKAPSLSNVADTKILVRYGSGAGVSAPPSSAVFSAGFVAVWHLEAPKSPASFADALGTHTGTAANLSSDPTVVAQLGHGVLFDGGVGEITFTNPLSGNTAHTISFWISQGATTDNDAIVVLGNGAADQSRWFHSAYTPSGTNPMKIATGFYGDDWSNLPPNVDIRGAGWKLLHWVYDGAGHSNMYVNGAFADGPNAAAGTVNTTGTGGHLGNAPAAWGTNMGAHAMVDEVRISNLARTPQWIAAEFANQNSPSAFYAVGAERPAP